MTWFKVDDKFWSHPKVMMIGLEARGLWITAGSWCSMHLMDGLIPDPVMQWLSPNGEELTVALARELERVGLWERDDEMEGWRFHEWSDHQPSREHVLAEQQKARERKARWMAKKNAMRNGVPDSVPNGGKNDAPTRPDPTPPKGGRVGGSEPEGSAPNPEPCAHGEPRGANACPFCRREQMREVGK